MSIFISYGSAYFELVCLISWNKCSWFIFIWRKPSPCTPECSKTESKVQSRGDNRGILFRSTLLRQIISNVNTGKLFLILTQMYSLCLHLRKKWRNIIHTQTGGLRPTKNESFKILKKELETLRLQYCKYDLYFHAHKSTQTGFSGSTTCCHFSKAFKYVYVCMY